MNILKTLVMGICIGMANVIPGVSGSTVAVIFNIYERFINAININLKEMWRNRRFVLPLFGGMAAGVLLFSKLITLLYTNFPVQTNYLFTGLIVGSIPLLFGYVKHRDASEKFGIGKIAGIITCILCGIAVILVFSYLEGTVDVAEELAGGLPTWTIGLAAKIFVAGVLGAVAMIVPGISGSLLMLIMGVYPIVMQSIPALFVPSTFVHALILLLPNGFGVLIGLFTGAKLIGILIKKCPNQIYAAIFGLLLGSAYHLFPGFGAFTGPMMIISSVGCFIVGVALAYFSTKLEPTEI